MEDVNDNVSSSECSTFQENDHTRSELETNKVMNGKVEPDSKSPISLVTNKRDECGAEASTHPITSESTCPDGQLVAVEDTELTVVPTMLDGPTLGQDQLLSGQNLPSVLGDTIIITERYHQMKVVHNTHSHNEVIVPTAFVSDVRELKRDVRVVPSNELPSLKVNISGVAVGKLNSVHYPRNSNQVDLNRGLVDTTAPFESVKDVVSKFGGIVDWKAHRIQTVSRSKLVDQELEKPQEESPEYKRLSEVAEEGKIQVLKELENTKRLIEELKLNLERAQIEEHQAKQDSELAKLRVEEIEQGICDEASVAAQTQLEVAKARHATAVLELKSVKEELRAIHKEYASLVLEKYVAVNKAEEAISASKEVEKTIEELTSELISIKESLESAHAAHLEAEEKRIGVAMAREEDSLNREKELKQAEVELQGLHLQIQSAKDLKPKLDTASALLLDLKGELAAYMESILKEEIGYKGHTEGQLEESVKTRHAHLEAALDSARQEHENVKLNTERTTAEVNLLKVAAASLTTTLEAKKSDLATLKQREKMESVAVASLEAEVEKTNSKIAQYEMKEKEAKEKMAQLPKQLQLAAQEADVTKSLTHMAREDLRKAKEEAEQVKAGVSTMESRLFAARKEIKAAKASKKLALAAIKALKESKSAKSANNVYSPNGVTLSLEEYYELSKCAHEVEEQANIKVAAVVSQIEVAKESEAKSLKKLEYVNRVIAARNEEFKIVMERVDKANDGKLGVEHELRKWRAEHEQQRKASEFGEGLLNLVKSARTSSEGIVESKRNEQTLDMSSSTPSPSEDIQSYSEADTLSDDTQGGKKKKRSFFPRVLMFLAKTKRKAHQNKST